MKIIKVVGVALVASAAALALASPAQAQVANWSANGESAVVDSDTVRLQGGNTSVETGNLNWNVSEGAEVSFDYKLVDGALCEAGAPRVFLIVNGINNKSDACDGSGMAETEGTITFTIGNAGLITQAGLVYDSGRPGHVLISNLTIDGEQVLFAPRPEPTEGVFPGPPGGDPEPPPTTEPEPSDPTPTTSPAGDTEAGESLPLTGDPMKLIGGGAVALLALGTVLALAARRRRRVTFSA